MVMTMIETAGTAEATWRALAARVADGRGPWRLPGESLSRPEQLVALAARTQLSEDEAAALRTLGEALRETEWEAVRALADDGYLTSLVYAQVAAVGLLPTLPPTIHAAFSDHYRATLLANLRIRTATERLLNQLAAAGIAAVPLKGVVLAERVYGNIAWRYIRDIDLLAPQEDVGQVSALLQASGYIAEGKHDHAHAFGAITGAEAKYERSDAPMIELHWGLSKRPSYRMGLPFKDVWARTVSATWRGRSIRLLAPHDELRFLAVHCTADHRASQLNWLVDIAELLRNAPAGWRWDAFVAETIAAGQATPVGLALAQCRAALGLAEMTVPDDALTELLRAALSPRERAAWRSCWADYLSRRWITAHLREIPSWNDRARFTIGTLGRLTLRTVYKRALTYP
jgi:putative nucleotidyltransferase-like protein